MIGSQYSQAPMNIKVQNSSMQQQDRNTVPIKRIDNFSYSPNDQIGLGMTSRVYKGKNDLTNDIVAIKMIGLKGNQDHLHNEFIKEEVKTLQQIKSLKAQNLLKLQGVIQTKNNLYIITEFCEGKDVGKLLRNKKIFNETQAQSIMKQVVNGYRQLYGLGIIHRDMKLSNLFISKGKVKIADFGFAITESKCNYNFGYNVGSPVYMPPQTLKYNQYSFYSDAWAIGVMAYELVYGKAPWKDKVDAKLFDLMVTSPIQTLFSEEVQVSNQYKQFMKRCLTLNIKERINPNELFNFPFSKAFSFVEGIVEQVKVPQVIKVPGNNYAVFNQSSKCISFEAKKMDVEDFRGKKNNAAEIALVGQLDYCLYLTEVYKLLSKQSLSQINKLATQISFVIRQKMKMLGEIVRSQKNILQTSGFSAYIKSGGWQNLKQVIIRYDIEFRDLFKDEAPLLKLHRGMPPNDSLFKQTLFILKNNLQKNCKIIKYLIEYREIREFQATRNPSNFGEHSGIENMVKEVSLNQNSISSLQLQRVAEKLKKMGF